MARRCSSTTRRAMSGIPTSTRCSSTIRVWRRAAVSSLRWLGCWTASRRSGGCRWGAPDWSKPIASTGEMGNRPSRSGQSSTAMDRNWSSSTPSQASRSSTAGRRAWRAAARSRCSPFRSTTRAGSSLFPPPMRTKWSGRSASRASRRRSCRARTRWSAPAATRC